LSGRNRDSVVPTVTLPIEIQSLSARIRDSAVPTATLPVEIQSLSARIRDGAVPTATLSAQIQLLSGRIRDFVAPSVGNRWMPLEIVFAGENFFQRFVESVDPSGGKDSQRRGTFPART
jgi:hypothetical protein